MRQRHLARPRPLAAAGQRRLAGAVVRLAVRRALHQPAALQHPGDAVDHADLQRLARQQVGQQSGQPDRQHRLAGPGRADQQQVVATGGGNLQRPLGGLHAAHLAHVGAPRGHRDAARLRRAQHLRAAEMVDQAEQVGGGQDGDAPGPSRLAALARRADQAEVGAAGRHRRRQHAGYRVQPAIQRQLAERREVGQVVVRQHPHGGQHGQRYGQVEMAALLQQVGGRQIDQHAAGRQRQAHGGERRAHPFARLADRLVRQADHQEGGQARGYLDLHLDRDGLDARIGERSDARD